MALAFSRWSLPLAAAVAAVGSADSHLTGSIPNPARRGVAYFEPPRSIGTPIDEVARDYTGLGLADKIAGRLRLDTDASLSPVTRDLIRRRIGRAQ
jgi:hypothetical protein